MAACWQSSSAGRNRFRAIYDAARFVRYEGSVGFNTTRGFVSVTILLLSFSTSLSPTDSFGIILYCIRVFPSFESDVS